MLGRLSRQHDNVQIPIYGSCQQDSRHLLTKHHFDVVYIYIYALTIPASPHPVNDPR